MNFIKVVGIVISLMPVLSDAIKGAEAAIGVGRGSDKLEAVRVVLENAYAQTGGVVTDFTLIWNILKPLITMLVPILTGKAPAAPAA